MGWKDNMYTDDTNLPEKGPEWNGLDIDKDVKKHADFVRTKKWGLDVRESLARAIEWISGMTNKKNAENKAIADGASKTANTAANEVKQVHSEIAAAIGKLTQDAEVVLARNDSEGKTWGTLKEHLDYIEQSRMTPSDLLSYLSNTEIEATFRLDFDGKIAGSTVENANTITLGGSSTLQPPTTNFREAIQTEYNLMEKKDGLAPNTTATTANVMMEVILRYDPIAYFEKVLGPDFFTKQVANTLAEKVALLKKIIYANGTEEKGGIFAYARGSSPMNNNVYARRWWRDSAWEGTSYSKTGTTIQKIGTALSAASINYFIAKDGCAYFLVYADPSDGKTLSKVEVDYAYLDITIKLSLYDFVASKVDLDALTKRVDAIEKNYVTTDTNQTVKGNKLFTGLTGKMAGIGKGNDAYFSLHDETAKRIGYLGFGSPSEKNILITNEIVDGAINLKAQKGAMVNSKEIAMVEQVEKKEDKVFRAKSSRAKVVGKWGGDVRFRREGKFCVLSINAPGDSTTDLRMFQTMAHWQLPDADTLGKYIPNSGAMMGLTKKNADNVVVSVEIKEDGMLWISSVSGTPEEGTFPNVSLVQGSIVYPCLEPNAADWALAEGEHKW